MKLPRPLVFVPLFLLMLSFPGWPAQTVRAASQGISTVQISPTRNCCSLINSVFNVNVLLTLPAGQEINGFDVRINYTNAFTSANPNVLRARSVTFSSNLFTLYSSSVLVDCIDDISQGGANGCPSDDSSTPGQIHFSEGIIGQTVSGPLNGALLFAITFSVEGHGVSVFSVDRANLVNPHPDPSNPQLINPVFIPVLKQDAVFGNQGVVSFFNFQPDDPVSYPAIIPNVQVDFNATASFVSENQSLGFRLYSWNFGDGTARNITGTPLAYHLFSSPGNYSVILKLWDTKNDTGVISRTVDVLPALGGLSMIVKDERGTVMHSNVAVRIFNSSSFAVPFARKSIDANGAVQFNGLLASDNYYLTFTGDTVDNYSKTESIHPGLVTQDTVYLPLKQPPPDYSGIIYIGTLLTGLGIVSAVIVYKRRQLGTGSSTRSRKVKNRNRSR